MLLFVWNIMLQRSTKMVNHVNKIKNIVGIYWYKLVCYIRRCCASQILWSFAVSRLNLPLFSTFFGKRKPDPFRQQRAKCRKNLKLANVNNQRCRFNCKYICRQRNQRWRTYYIWYMLCVVCALTKLHATHPAYQPAS